MYGSQLRELIFIWLLATWRLWCPLLVCILCGFILPPKYSPTTATKKLYLENLTIECIRNFASGLFKRCRRKQINDTPQLHTAVFRTVPIAGWIFNVSFLKATRLRGCVWLVDQITRWITPLGCYSAECDSRFGSLVTIFFWLTLAAYKIIFKLKEA